jgi:hypothetical protein
MMPDAIRENGHLYDIPDMAGRGKSEYRISYFAQRATKDRSKSEKNIRKTSKVKSCVFSARNLPFSMFHLGSGYAGLGCRGVI